MSGNRRYFVDTNVLLYYLDKTNTKKQQRSREWLAYLWQAGAGRLSWQVLHEFYVNAVRKMGVAREEARFLVGALLEWGPVENSAALLERAWHWGDSAQVAYWDALIVGAAEVAGCGILLSEDFQNGHRFGELVVVNPFMVEPPVAGVGGGED